jgi:valyl-tRNA synthetase
MFNNINNLKKNKPLTIVCPPPNVTGNLHIGHCLNFTLIDIWTRTTLLNDHPVIVVGGTDHAANATTIMVRKHYPDVTPENFHGKAMEWIEKAQQNIINQIKDLGVIMDWDKFCYTMDPVRTQGVIYAFNILYNKGLIYKAKKMVNWDTHFGTAISDLEVIMKPQESVIYEIPYELSDGSGFITVASTRPETIFADCAIAINPHDEKNIHLLNKTIKIPIINKEIPIISSESVDKDFGTGFLKITPGHSMDDYNIWLNHPVIKDMEAIDLMDNHGIFCHGILPQEFQGLTVNEARKLTIQQLNLLGKPLKNHIPISDRSETVVEWKITDQWFFEVQNFKEKAWDLLDKKIVRFFPKNLINTYKNWIDNLQSWCISRDLPLGHRIPVWYDEYNNQYVGHDYNEAAMKAEIYWKNENLTPTSLIQDHHCLDTWFSSGLFHKTALGWPHQISGATLMVTGYDILFFWITRMILMSIGLDDHQPFANVAFHGLIRDKYGNKMSKTRGNTIDPYEIAKEYGWDNLRLTLAMNSRGASDIQISKESFEITKRILTKIKNAHNYCHSHFKTLVLDEPKVIHPICQDMIHITNNFTKLWTANITNYINFNDGIKLAINQFLYKDFCDSFIEIHKVLKDEIEEMDDVLSWIFFQLLMVLHSSCPFITDEIFSQYHDQRLLHYNFYKRVSIDPLEFHSSIEMVSVIRFFQQVFHSKNIQVKINNLPKVYENMILKLTKTQLLMGDGIVQYGPYLVLDGINKDPEILSREIKKLEHKIDQLNKNLSNENFIKKADESIVILYQQELKNHTLLMNCLKKIL